MSFDIATIAVSNIIDGGNDASNSGYYKLGYAYGSPYYGSITTFTLDSSDNLTILSDGDPYPGKAGSVRTYTNNGTTTRVYGTKGIIEQYYNVTFPYLGGKGVTDTSINSIDSDGNTYELEAIGVLITGAKIGGQSGGYGVYGYPFSYTSTNTGGYTQKYYIDTTDLPTTDSCDNDVGHLTNAGAIDFISGLDDAGGHISPSGYTSTAGDNGQYHLHDSHFLSTSSAAWNNLIFRTSNTYISGSNYSGSYLRHSDGHSKILGICFDGYPIYGPYGYSDQYSSSSSTILMVSGYRTMATEFLGRPLTYTDTYKYANESSTATAEAGVYIEDYEYVEGLGTLDEHNGRYCVTPEYPDGTYAYFMTMDEDEEPVFPYIIGLSTKNTIIRPNIDASISGATYAGSPTNVSVSRGDQYATISFSAPSDDGGSRITTYLIADSDGNIDASGTQSPLSVSGLNNETAYTFYVKAMNLTGISTNSATASVTKYTVPDAPENITVVTATQTATITFETPSSNGSDILYYTIINATTGNTDASGTQSPLTVTGLTNGSTYSFYVRAINGLGTSNNSGTVSVLVGIPSAPQSVAAVPGNAKATISFSAPSSNGSDILYYTITNSTTGNTDASGTQSPLTVSGLTNGYTYSYYVRAINASGTSDASETVSVIVGTPTQPTSVVATPGNKFITISFSAPDSSGAAVITKYIVYNNETGSIDSSGTSTSIRVSGLTNGTTYSHYVAAQNTYGIGTSSSIVSATAGTPNAPTNVSAVAGNAYINVSFTGSTSTGGSTITNYNVYDASGNIDASGSSSPISVSGLTNGTTYTYYVKGENSKGTGSASSSVSATPYTVPGIPQDVSGVAGNQTVKISFSAPSSTGGSAITGYTILDVSTNVTTTTTDLSATIISLTNGTTYSYKVAAVNLAGTGSYSSAVSATPYTVPGIPQDVSGVAGNQTVKISFSAPSSTGGSAITGYTILDVSTNVTTTTTDLSATIISLTNGTTYSYKVAAVNLAGTGSYSSAVSATPTADGNYTDGSGSTQLTVGTITNWYSGGGSSGNINGGSTSITDRNAAAVYGTGGDGGNATTSGASDGTSGGNGVVVVSFTYVDTVSEILDVYTPYIYSDILATSVSSDSSIVPPTSTVSSLTTRNRYCIKTNDTYLQISDLYAVEFDTTLVTYKNYMTKIFQFIADTTNTSCYRIASDFNYMYYLDYDTTNSNLKFKNNRGSIDIPSTNGYLCFTYSSNKLQVIKRYSYSNTAYTHSQDTTFAYLNYYVQYSSGSLILTSNINDASTFVFYNTPMDSDIPTNLNPIPTAYQTNSAVNIADYVDTLRINIEGNIPRDPDCKFLPYFYSSDGTTKLVSTAGYTYAYQLTSPGYNTSTNYYAELMLSTIATNILTNTTYNTLRYDTSVYKTYREGALKFVLEGDSVANGETGMNTCPYVYFTCERDDSNQYNPFMCIASFSISDRVSRLNDVCKPPGDGSGPYVTSSVTRDATLQLYLVKIPMLNYGFSGDISGSVYYNSATGTTIDSNTNTNDMQRNTLAYKFMDEYSANGNERNGQRIYTTINYNNYNYTGTASIGIMIDGVILYPVLNNSLTSAQTAAEVTNSGIHVGQGMGLHYHSDGYTAAFFVNNNTNNMFLYNNKDFIGRQHPPIIGFALDGIAIYGTYTSDYTSMSGYDVELDSFGGHSHGEYGYHYHCHNFQNNSTTDINADEGTVTVYQQFVIMKGAYKGNINLIPDFDILDPDSVTFAQKSKYVWGYVRT